MSFTPRPYSVAARLRAVRREGRKHEHHEAQSARSLVTVAFGPALIISAVTLALAALVVLLGSGNISSIPSVAGGFWLAAHHVPLTINEVTIGVLPLLPSLAIIWLVAEVVARATAPHRTLNEIGKVSEIGGIVVATLVGVVLFTAIATGLLADSGDQRVQVVTAAAFGWSLLVHFCGVFLGMLRSWWPVLAQNFDAVTVRGLRSGVIVIVGLLTLSGLLVTVRIVLRWNIIGELFSYGGGVLGGVGLLLLSIAYLPNVLIASTSVLVGAPVTVGEGTTVDLLGSTGGRVPPLPILGILPEGSGSAMGAVFFIGTALIAGYVGYLATAREMFTKSEQLRSVLFAGLVVSTAMVVCSSVAGGTIGVLGSASFNPAAAGVYSFGWIAVVGSLVVVIPRKSEVIAETVLPTDNSVGDNPASSGLVDSEREE